MNEWTDQQLLREYTVRRSEAAFAELTRRHLDLVYSAALRMVRDPHLAEDVAQGTFLALAQSGRKLLDCAVLSSWLHQTARNLAANIIRSNARRLAREQEAAAMTEVLSAEPDATWDQIAPHLDAAIAELSDPDRDAIMLRYFERKSAKEMAQTLRLSDEAAQKRAARAVERLRDYFAKHGVTIGAGGLVAVLSVNAVQAAPVGLAATLTTAVLSTTCIATTSVVAASKAITMTTLQKTLIGATLAAAVGTGIYEAHQTTISQAEVQRLRQQHAVRRADRTTGEALC